MTLLKSLVLVVICFVHVVTPIQLVTKANSKLSASQLQDFISRPSNWPQIVASSNGVESSSSSSPNAIDMPLTKGTSVKEYFGLNLLSVNWTCRESKPGRLLVESPDGLDGIADQCSMQFDFPQNDDDSSNKQEVLLTMAYNPISPLAVLATPILVVDNWVALNILLPAAVDPNPLNSFRTLMGQLYGIAGVAHLADILAGESVLFTSAGIPVYTDLPLVGQAYAWFWCAVGPLSYFATSIRKEDPSNRPSLVADGSLVLYGLVEVIGVILASTNSEVLINAIAVQGIVSAAWIYSYKKGKAIIS
mmetsp:Transcript_5835/g.6781  ORF Transcript_5835/g.6781 Transcript_5835/m.6781 type:complete len:305 (-) Transcript_5835:235-1149(-)